MLRQLVESLNRIEAGGAVVTRLKLQQLLYLKTKLVMKIHLRYDEYEMTVISQSFEQGFSAFEINVKLRDDCLLKAARVYMVFEILEKSGEIIKSEPKVERLENEDFNETIYSGTYYKRRCGCIES